MIAITVLIPTFNPNAQYLKEMLLSLNKQSIQNFEVLIVDESTSFDINFIRSIKYNFKIKIIKPKKKIGLASSLALGVNQIKTKYIARIDSDDLMHPNRLEKQFNFMENNSDIDVLGSAVQKIDSRGYKIGLRRFPLEDKEIKASLHLWNSIAHPALIIRRSFFEKYGNYSTDLHNEDYELWLRASKLGANFHNLKNPYLFYRIQEEIGISRRRYWKENFMLKIKYFNYQYFAMCILGLILVLFASLSPSFLLKPLSKLYNKFI